MNRLFMPLILIVSAILLFVLWTDPTYQETKTLKVEVAAYDDALNKSQELRRLRDSYIAKRNTFNEQQLGALHRMLPDHVDNIRLIIDINGIAARHGLSLSDVELGEVSDSAQARNELAVGSSGDVVGSVTLGFTLSATYDELLIFLQDIEHSLRLIDIEQLEFDVTPGEQRMAVHFTVRTYWLH